MDKKGNSFSYPKVVPSLPFSDSGTTYFSSNSYSLSCGGVAGTGRVSPGSCTRFRKHILSCK